MRDNGADWPTAPMTSKLVALTFASRHPARLAAFWQKCSAGKPARCGSCAPTDSRSRSAVASRQDGQEPDAPGPHEQLARGPAADGRQSTRRRRATHRRGSVAGRSHVVLCDPEGNEFCVVEPGNRFLAGCGVLGCVAETARSGSGYFWGAALGWPLVWDRDRETAIQSPDGGSKLSWGGEEGVEHIADPQLHYALAAIGDRDAEVAIASHSPAAAT